MIEDRFQLVSQLGFGSFSVVHKALDTKTNKSVAIKVINKEHSKLFLAEAKALKSLSSSNCYPKLICSGPYSNSFAIVMQYLGPTVSIQMKKKAYPLPDIINIGMQMAKALEVLHENDLLHRDLKLENIATDRKDKSKFFLIDLGLASTYRDPKTKFHYPERSSDFFKGNLMFCSSNVLCGMQASRRDDIISLMLVLIYMVKGSLPWIKQLGSIEAMISKRTGTSLDMIIGGLPEGLAQCYRYAMTLGFYQKPDYEWIINTLKTVQDAFNLEKNKPVSSQKKSKHKKHRKTIKIRLSSTQNIIKGDYYAECSTIKMLAPEFTKEFRMKLNLQKSDTAFIDSI